MCGHVAMAMPAGILDLASGLRPDHSTRDKPRPTGLTPRIAIADVVALMLAVMAAQLHRFGHAPLNSAVGRGKPP